MIAYFDTSALVKLLVEEPGSDLVEQVWWASDRRLCATVGRAEAMAALAKAGRTGRLSAHGVRRGARDLIDLWSRLHRIPVDDQLAADAGELALGHGLRGYDAVHLAAALVGADLLVAADADLSAAGQAEGLAITVWSS